MYWANQRKTHFQLYFIPANIHNRPFQLYFHFLATILGFTMVSNINFTMYVTYNCPKWLTLGVNYICEACVCILMTFQWVSSPEKVLNFLIWMCFALNDKPQESSLTKDKRKSKVMLTFFKRQYDLLYFSRTLHM